MSCLWYRREEATLRESVAFGNLGGAGTSTQALVEMDQRGKGTGVSERDVVKIGNVIERRRTGARQRKDRPGRGTGYFTYCFGYFWPLVVASEHGWTGRLSRAGRRRAMAEVAEPAGGWEERTERAAKRICIYFCRATKATLPRSLLLALSWTPNLFLPL